LFGLHVGAFFTADQALIERTRRYLGLERVAAMVPNAIVVARPIAKIEVTIDSATVAYRAANVAVESGPFGVVART
jgi:hypothetical protein